MELKKLRWDSKVDKDKVKRDRRDGNKRRRRSWVVFILTLWIVRDK